ncbi:unnamed protein product [Prorocentrum cordatum]|uniref:N-acetyltransferase domain-containing protein n=1 Tax=Prorocentrum cordatum TaxID=2364126 RepID=A0ABN9VN27_9DINO|nr:unnamed protein product [Polarella glacialis]
MSARGQQDLAHLVQHGSLDALRTSLPSDAGRWVNSDQRQGNAGQTLLFTAVQRDKDCREVCELLLDVHKVDPNAQDKRGQTALHYLAKTKHLACVDLLVARGCKVDHVDKYLHQTPLFYAARWSTRDMVKRLVDHKAEVNFRDARGQTPMFWAESLEVCSELMRGRGDACLAVDTANVTVAESHRLRPNPQHDISDFLATCAEVRRRSRLTWAVQRVEPAGTPASGGYGNWFAYTTSIARGGDVDQLCELENEFVEDHRQMLGSALSEAELWNQVGLNPDATTRRNTIRSITQVTPGTPRSGKVRHYTVKCVHMPPNPDRVTGTPRNKTHRVVGYVYFRICEGDREDGAGARGARGARSGAADSSAARAAPGAATGRAAAGGASDAAAAGAEARDAKGTRGHIVVSHLKVNAHHQRRGVATLLLAGMLQLVETEHKGFSVSHLYLSVVAKNASAAALYRKLGFVQTFRDGETVQWLHMKR